MAYPMGGSDRRPLRPIFDRCLKLEFHGSRVTSNTVLLAYRELDDALGLTAMAGDLISDSRTGKNGWHGLIGLLRQSVFSRLAGCEDINDSDRRINLGAIRPCAGSSPVRPPNVTACLVAGWAGPRQNRWPRTTTSPLSPTSPVFGSAGCMSASHRRSSCWTWIASSARPSARRRSGLQRPFLLLALSPAVRVPSVRRSGAVRA